MVRQDPFNQKKASILAEICSDEQDLSPKGDVDVLCFPIMNLINSHKDMVTTSSCSGRVSVFIEGDKQHKGSVKPGGKGEGGRWLFVTHDVDDVIGWLNEITSENVEFYSPDIQDNTKDFEGSERLVLYKYEPFILHVKCRDFVAASKLYNAAMACGYRESGIGSNNLVAIRTSIKLDIPIGIWNPADKKIQLLVTRDYIEIIDKLTVTKFEENTRKMNKLHDCIERTIISSTIHSCSK